jgi:hypothetical protein
MTRKREREGKMREIDLTQMPRDVWDLVSQFLSLEDLKNLSQVNRVLVHRMRVLMMSKYRFVVSGSLADFRALGWTRACLNIRIERSESVFQLSEDDVFVDIVLSEDFNLRPDEDISWPSRLTHLTFGYWFNQPVDHLPASLTHLEFGYWFDQPVDHLPASLTQLTLRGRFNQPVDRLPASLTHLTLKGRFNQPVDHLPASLTHLEFGYSFNQSVKHLPASLKRVYVPGKDQNGLFAPEYRHLIFLSKP